MELTKFDVMLLFCMSLAVVSISFVFPALGMSDTEAEENDIPELDISEDKFDFAGEMPEFPNTANKGTLFFNTTKDAGFSENSIWLEGNTDGGYELVLIQEPTNETAEVVLTEWNDSGEVEGSSSVVINDSNPREIVSQGEYEVAIEEGADNNPPDYLQVQWEIVSQSQAGGSFVGRLPGVGAIFDVGSAIAAVVAWAVTIFIWFSQTLVQGFLNILGTVYDGSAYFINLLAWLISTYGSVISGATGWVSIFVALPGIILSVTLGKIVIIFIGLLPTT